jgi:hypothetical protein
MNYGYAPLHSGMRNGASGQLNGETFGIALTTALQPPPSSRRGTRWRWDAVAAAAHRRSSPLTGRGRWSGWTWLGTPSRLHVATSGGPASSSSRERGDLPFPEACFDVVPNVESCHCYPDVPRFLKRYTEFFGPEASCSWRLCAARISTRQPSVVSRTPRWSASVVCGVICSRSAPRSTVPKPPRGRRPPSGCGGPDPDRCRGAADGLGHG